MKSQQSDKGMTCYGCKFAKRVGNLQVGCSAKRIKRFKERNEVETLREETGTIFSIKRFCNLYRDRESDTTLQEARKEIEPTFGISIYDNGQPFEVEKTINSILECDYDKSKIAVVITSVNSRNVSLMTHMINLLISSGAVKSKLVLSGDVPVKVRDFDCFHNLHGFNYLTKLISGENIDANFFKDIDISINDHLEKNIVFTKDNVMCTSFSAINSEYLKYNDFDKTNEEIKQAAQLHNMVRTL
jgi:hypothetical protein